MTPKEKAIELIDKFNNHTVKELVYLKNGKVIEGKTEAKQCALIAVNEIIEATNMYQYGISNALEHIPSKIVKHPYWQEVKQEIEAL